tara:strand:- start:17176 stop:18015 length:840 start_codon:yes stop_codon:yes gene_type:complete
MSSEDRAGQDWNEREIDLIVADYFDMRDMELRGERYVKSQRNAALQSLIGRSRGSIELKHQNISAVLMKLGEPWISGYKPMMNFQTALIEGIERFIESQTGRVIPFPVQKKGVADAAQLFLEQAPDMTQEEVDDDEGIKRLIRKFDPAARDARNRELGKLGEARVLASEQTRLTSDGRADLADKIRWVSELDGDGAGYDILSFEKDGSERYLEVKTTVGYRRTPFYLSRNEIRFSQERPDGFRLFRLYDFAKAPKAFVIEPPLEHRLVLEPTNYQASFG